MPNVVSKVPPQAALEAIASTATTRGKAPRVSSELAESSVKTSRPLPSLHETLGTPRSLTFSDDIPQKKPCDVFEISSGVIPGHVTTFWLWVYHPNYLVGFPTPSTICLLLSYYGVSWNPVERPMIENQRRDRSAPSTATGAGNIPRPPGFGI